MKKKYILIMFTLLLISSSSLAQYYSGGHDSLIFDGARNNSISENNPCGCTIKILKQSGMTFATWCEKVTGKTCGEIDTFYNITKSIVPLYITEILDTDTIRTGSVESSEHHLIDLQLNDGKTLSLGPDTKILIGKNHCTKPIDLFVYTGLVYLDLTGGDKNKTIAIRTDKGIVVNKGTRYTIEIVKEGDISIDVVKVYDGSVTFQKNLQSKENKKKTKDKAAEMKKLTDDFQSGKISIEEFTKKMAELQKDLSETLPQNDITVNADYESRIVGTENPTEPVPFDTNENQWWE